MPRDSLNDLAGFLAVARERSFTRAAAQLGVSPSALSHAMRGLEERLGVRLLTRTTRSVAPTEAGERLLQRIGPHFEGIETELAALSELRTKPAGTVRITALDHAAEAILWPAVARLLPDYPDIVVEISVDNALTDIVEGRFDAGIRLGEQVARDMIAVPIGPAMRMACVGAPAYLARAAAPPPAAPHDLAAHACINLRFATSGGLYAWEFEKDGRELRVRVEGPLILNDPRMIRRAALAGFGLAFLPEDHVADDLAAGTLVRLLDDWTPPFPGYHLYYPSRRQHSPAFALLLEALRYRP